MSRMSGRGSKTGQQDLGHLPSVAPTSRHPPGTRPASLAEGLAAGRASTYRLPMTRLSTQAASPPPGLVIVLNGTSSSGKSTLARCLQDRWSGPLLDAGLDRHLSMLPRHYLGPAWPEVYRYALATDGTIAAISLGPVGRSLYRAMHRAVAAMARTGADVVVDHVILDRWTATDLIGALDGVPTTLVGVRLGEPELSRRERAREIRTLGQAAAQLPVVHAHVSYDLEVDTARLSAEEAADAVLRWLAEKPRG